MKKMIKNIKEDLLAIFFFVEGIIKLVYFLQIVDLILKRNYVSAFWLFFLFIVYVFYLKNKLLKKIIKISEK